MNETADHMTLELRYYLSWSQHFLNLKKKNDGRPQLVDTAYLFRYIYLFI